MDEPIKPSLPETAQSMLPGSAQKKPSFFIIVMVGALLLLLCAFLILFSRQKKNTAQNQSLTNNTTVITPTVAIYQKLPTPTINQAVSSSLTQTYTSNFFTFKYPVNWITVQTQKSPTFMEVQAYLKDTSPNDLRVTVTAVKNMTDSEKDSLQELYGHPWYTKEEIAIGQFKMLYKETAPQEAVNPGQTSPMSQRRITFFYKGSTMYRVIMTYPGDVANTQYEDLLRLVLATFSPHV